MFQGYIPRRCRLRRLDIGAGCAIQDATFPNGLKGYSPGIYTVRLVDGERALAALAGVSKSRKPRKTDPSPEHRVGLAPEARERISRELSEIRTLAGKVSFTRPLWRVLRDSLELGCVLAFPVTGLGLVAIGAILLLHELAQVAIDLAPGRSRLEVVGSAVVFGSAGWLLMGIAWELPSGGQIRRRRFRLDTSPARLWRALAAVAGVLGILGSIKMVVTEPVWPTLSLGGMLLLASGATAVFAVAPVAVLITWALKRWWHSPRSTFVTLPVLLITWAVGTGFLFGWVMR